MQERGTRAAQGSGVRAVKRRVYDEDQGRDVDQVLFFGRLPEHHRRGVAKEIARHIRFKGQADDEEASRRPLTEADIHLAAAAMLVRIAEQLASDGSHGTGQYFSDSETAGLYALVAIAKGTTGKAWRRRAIHELAHHLQRTWVAPALYHVEDVICRGDGVDHEGDRHEIARVVEEALV